MTQPDSSEESFNDGNQGTQGFEPVPPLAQVISCNLRQAILKALEALFQVYKTGRINSYFIEILKEHTRKRHWLDTCEQTFSNTR